MIRLSNGDAIMAGEGEVVESVKEPTPDDQVGMRIRLVDLDSNARAVHERLLAAAQRTSGPGRTLPPFPTSRPGVLPPPRSATPAPSPLRSTTLRPPTSVPAPPTPPTLATPEPAVPTAPTPESATPTSPEVAAVESQEASPTEPNTRSLETIRDLIDEAVEGDNGVTSAQGDFVVVPVQGDSVAGEQREIGGIGELTFGSSYRWLLQSLSRMPRVVVPVQWVFVAGAVTALFACAAGLGLGYGIWGGDDDEEGASQAASSPSLAIPSAEAAILPSPLPPADPAPSAEVMARAVASPSTPAVGTAPRSPDVASGAEPAEPPAKMGHRAEAPGVLGLEAVDPNACSATLTTRGRRADVLWNGKRIGETPMEGVVVPCGPATVEFDRPRYQRETRRVSAAPGRPVHLSVRLSRPPAVLSLFSSPVGASFEVGGRAVGKGPIKAAVAGFQRVTISATKGGYQRWSQNVYVRRGGMTIKAVLKPVATRKGRAQRSSGYDLAP